MSRRDVLAGGLATTLAGCTPPVATPSDVPTPERDPTPVIPTVEGDPDLDLFPWGVVVAEVLAGSALIRVRAVGVERCNLVVMQHREGVWVELGRPEIVRNGFTCRHVLDGLTGESVYAVYAVRGTRRSRITRFRTAPANQPSRRIRFGATSCLGDGNWDMENLIYAGVHDLDFFALLGDTVYADGSRTVEDYQDVWTEHLRRPAMRNLIASTGLLSVWDDHEVDNNWTLEPGRNWSIEESQLRAAVETLDATLPQRRGPGGSRWRSHRWGEDLELFLLDCRSERSEGQMVSEEQLAWLESRLPASSARFKIVLSSVHVTDHYSLLSTIEQDDRWQGYPEQRARLVSLLASVPGAFVVTGDMHFGSVQHVDAEGPGASVVEVAAGPSGSRTLLVDAIVEVLGELPPQYVLALEAWTWCRFDLDPGTGEVHVEFIGDDGEVWAEHRFVV